MEQKAISNVTIAFSSDLRSTDRSALFNNTDCSKVKSSSQFIYNHVDINYLCENSSTVSNIVNVSANDLLVRKFEEMRHNMLVDETVKVGLMFASKAIIQIFTNPLIGPLTNR